MSIYFLGLSLVPCADGHAMSVNDRQEIILTHSGRDTSHGDVCQPLCCCSCCGTQLTVSQCASLHLPVPIRRSQFLIRDVSFISCDKPGIWQPPKIS